MQTKEKEPTLYHYKINFSLDKDKFSLEDFNEKISQPIQDLFYDDLGKLYDILHEVDSESDYSLGWFTFSFTSERQFRWEDQTKEIIEAFPLYSSNLRVPFTMKGGIFSQLALILLQNDSDGTVVDVSFFNKELDEWRDVQISKNLDDNGISYGRFDDVF